MSLPARRSRRGRRVATAMLAPVALLLAACAGASGSDRAAAPGTSSGPSGTSSGTPAAGTPTPDGVAPPAPSESPSVPDVATFPITVTGANGSLTLKAQPKAIVSLAPSVTEMLFAIGAGGQVKAVDDQSNYPDDAPRTKLSGFQPNAEAIAGYKPDLVVLSSDANGVVAGLTKLGVPTLVLPAAKTLQDSYTQETTLGAATGHANTATRVVGRTKQRIAAAVAGVPKGNTVKKIYHEIDQTYYSVTSATFIGDLYAQFGLKNIADAATKPAGGYPQLSAEFVVAAAPDLIVLADAKCCGQDPATVAGRAAFAGVPAVKNGRVIAVDDDIASRWGPRVSQFAEQIARALGGTA